MDKKKILTIGSIIVIVLSIIISIFIITDKKDENDYKIEGIELPENQEILKDTTVDELKITDISLLTRDGISTYKAKVSNDTKKDIKIDSLYVVFYEEKNENKIIALKNSIIKSQGEIYINISSETDLSNTTEIKYILELNEEQ